MYTCETCGFETVRLANFQRHVNRKIPCKNVQERNAFRPKRNVFDQKRNVFGQNVTENGPKRNGFSENVTVPKGNFCEVCEKSFTNRQAKYRHKLKNNCEPPSIICQPVLIEALSSSRSIHELESTKMKEDKTCPFCNEVFSRADNLKRHLAKCDVTNSRSIITTHNHYNNNHNTTTTNNNDHSTTNITINVNSFDKPSVDHVNKELITQLYYKAGRNLKKLIHEGVRTIWEREENNSFKLPFSTTRKKISDSLFRNNETLEVYSDGNHRMLPANHVVDVVLQKSAQVCESYLRQHHYDDDVPGVAVLKHADVLEGLAIEYQETWDEDKRFRDGYKPFVQSALIECMLLAAERAQANAIAMATTR